MKVLIVSSLGGHLEQMKNFYTNSPTNYQFILITEDRLKDMNLNWFDGQISLIKSHGGEIRKYYNFFLNSCLAFYHLIFYKPDIIISSGSHTCIPYFFLAKLFGIKSVFILSFSRRLTKAKTADIVYGVTDLFIVQWEEALKNYPNGIYLESTLYH